MRKTILVLVMILFVAPAVLMAQSNQTNPDTQAMRRKLQELEQRLQKLEETQGNASNPDVKAIRRELNEMEHRLNRVERKAALDRLNITGDFRFEAHSIQGATVPAHYDGMLLQNMMVNTLFYYQATQMLPSGPGDVSQYVATHYGDYQYFTQNLTFDKLKAMMAQFPPAMQQQLQSMLLPYTYVPSYGADNNILYTSRLRLNIDAKVADNVVFMGRLSMYKPWGDSTGVQVFNGLPNSINMDGTTAGVPNSDILRVERAFFTWKDIAGLPVYLSIGRRPSTEGPPLNLREGDPRGGTPMGSLIDFQFDGMTFGWDINEHSTFRVCYGLGYESGFGNGELIRQPADRLHDAQLAGVDYDIWHSDSMLLQLVADRAFHLTDGFNSLVVMPNNPVTGQPIGAPLVMRFTPTANIGNMDEAGILMLRHDGPVDWFVNFNYMHSDPANVTGPFGGLFSDPFEAPVSHNAQMWYAGARYNFNEGKTMVGIEYNHGSKYWFNFTPAQDDIIAPKTATRGDVWEAYVIHKIARRFMVKLDYINYQYDYSGSGWDVGAPKKLDATPILGYPTYDKASMFTLSMVAKF